MSLELMSDIPRLLRIKEHTVHRCDPCGDNTDYVISTLKDFSLGIELIDGAGQVLHTHEPITLTAELVYESGKEVEQVGGVPNIVVLSGGGLVHEGRTTWKLKVSVLSSLRTQQRFRLLISAPDEHSIAPVHTQPFRTLTKLYRSAKRTADTAGLGETSDAPPAPAAPGWTAAERAWVQSLHDDLKTLRDEVAVLKAQMAMMAPLAQGSM